MNQLVGVYGLLLGHPVETEVVEDVNGGEIIYRRGGGER